MQKIKNIEFLRIIGCLAIIFYHMLASNHRLHGMFGDIELYKHLYDMVYRGCIAVDLFFILSGLFFALKLDVTKSVWEFLKHKLIRLYPVLLFITVIYFIISLFGIAKFNLYDNILGLLCLNGTGLAFRGGNLSIAWYVSTMLWVLGIYFYLFKHFKTEKMNPLIGAVILFCYCFLIHARHGNIGGNFKVYNYVFSAAMMRGFAGIGVGYFIGFWYKNNVEKFKNYIPDIKSKLFLTLIEFACLFFIIQNLMLHKLKYNNEIIFIIAFIMIIVLFLFQKGYISKFLEIDLWSKFSKYTYSLYMTHSLLMNILKETFWKDCPEFVYAHPLLNIVFTTILIVIFGCLTYHFIEKPCANYLKNYGKSKGCINCG